MWNTIRALQQKTVSRYNFQKGGDDRHRPVLDDFVAFKIKHYNDKC